MQIFWSYAETRTVGNQQNGKVVSSRERECFKKKPFFTTGILDFVHCISKISYTSREWGIKVRNEKQWFFGFIKILSRLELLSFFYLWLNPFGKPSKLINQLQHFPLAQVCYHRSYETRWHLWIAWQFKRQDTHYN